ncbi:MAG: FAD-binding oxidoreductase [Alphaproteobacteria bacterium]|nr:FAD-binding oxidoreductase [Alphaproteobacteria bacterium]
MTEFVIIGGGVYGAGVAWWLAERGADVRLLEAKQIGNGASAGPGRRGTRANGRDWRELPLMKLAHEMWPSLHERLGVPQFFERLGHLLLIECARDLQMAEARCLLQNQHGTETHMLPQGQVREREPEVCDDIIAALYCPLDGVSDHTAVTNAFAAAARKAGVVISENTPVQSIETDGGRASAVITGSGERIEVGKSLFVLSNAGVQGMLQDRISLPIWNRAFQVMLTEPLAHMPINHLIGHLSRTLAIKEEAGNRLMISGGYPGIWDPVTETGTAIESSMQANLADTVAVYSSLEGVGIELADADHLESVAVDDIPVIDLVPGTDNAIYATAWSGHGWAIAPSVTQMLADWGMSGKRPEHLVPFSHERFSA